ncbi:MAG TPA: N-acetyl-gamma-glutamyl-phosphate reductase [Gammaproteobacteria bacterium]|nr:N-acetyl-gamma-glutamyl-phosphate reductase [Gammaproteobacteria bacterium]
MATQNVIRAGIVGGTGYTGAELLRLLTRHPAVELAAVTSRSRAGTPVVQALPNLRGKTTLAFVPHDDPALRRCDVVFFATPHGTAMSAVPGLLEAGVRVIDLGADFRLADAGLWQQWYGAPHACPELLDQVVYGLPEVNRDAIRGAALVANPGCYPTAVILGLVPLMEHGRAAPQGLIADAKSGVSGAGRKAVEGLLYSELSDSFKAYSVSGHRHLPEIEQLLQQVAGRPVALTFVPHLVPMVRGLHATLYATLAAEGGDVQAWFERRYAGEPFVDVMPSGGHPETRGVKGSNTCRIAVHSLPDRDRVVVLSVIDNLVKGAAGQAVQNMNLMYGLEETAGLEQIAMLP